MWEAIIELKSVIELKSNIEALVPYDKRKDNFIFSIIYELPYQIL